MSKAVCVVVRQCCIWLMVCLFSAVSTVTAKQIDMQSNAQANAQSIAQNEQYVVLMSLDGFRHDYIELHDAKHLRRIAEAGVRTESLTPVYPANTFPNHISLVKSNILDFFSIFYTYIFFFLIFGSLLYLKAICEIIFSLKFHCHLVFFAVYTYTYESFLLTFSYCLVYFYLKFY